MGLVRIHVFYKALKVGNKTHMIQYFANVLLKGNKIGVALNYDIDSEKVTKDVL